MKVAIINRSFWPIYPVIGEALFQFAERAVKCGHSVSVIMQDHVGIKGELKKAGRGQGIRFFASKALTTSAGSVRFRALDAVFFMIWALAVLVWTRPSRVYVSTDPPVLVPFIVMLYSRLFRAEYVYHLQDIHPQATQVVVPVNKVVFWVLNCLDRVTRAHAKRLVTITDQMASELRHLSGSDLPVQILDNPAVSFEGINTTKPKNLGFSFCGNAGRLQRIPMLLQVIRQYFEQGGTLDFVFAGGGVYAEDLASFSSEFTQFKYLGLINSGQAAQINADYAWALLPIEDEVTRYAFPSKTSSYVFADANILAICGEQTSVAQWVRGNELGLVVSPEAEQIVKMFFEIEQGEHNSQHNQRSRDELKSNLRFEVFVEALDRAVLN